MDSRSNGCGRTALWVFVAVSCVLAAGSAARADLVQGTISATGVVQLEGEWDGYQWYRYTYTIEWSDFDYGLSHVNLLQLAGCAEPDHLYLFPMDLGEANDGWSTGEDWEEGMPICQEILYEGEFLRTGGDPSVPDAYSPDNLPVVKFEPIDAGTEPGNLGIGEFTFVANILPATGTLTDVVVAKHDGMIAVGDLSGAYPSCTVVPEPTTMALLGLGMGTMLIARKRR